jgi:hypothetical protein
VPAPSSSREAKKKWMEPPSSGRRTSSLQSSSSLFLASLRLFFPFPFPLLFSLFRSLFFAFSKKEGSSTSARCSPCLVREEPFVLPRDRASMSGLNNLAEGLGQVDLTSLLSGASGGLSGGSANSSGGLGGNSGGLSGLLHQGSSGPPVPLSELLNSARQQQQQQQQQQASPAAHGGQQTKAAPASPANSLTARLASLSSPGGTPAQDAGSVGLPPQSTAPPLSAVPGPKFFASPAGANSAPIESSSECLVCRDAYAPSFSVDVPAQRSQFAIDNSYPVSKLPTAPGYLPFGDTVAVSSQFICYVVKSSMVRILGRRTGSRLLLKDELVKPGTSPNIAHLKFRDGGVRGKELLLIGFHDGRALQFALGEDVNPEGAPVVVSTLLTEVTTYGKGSVRVLNWSPVDPNVFFVGDAENLSLWNPNVPPFTLRGHPADGSGGCAFVSPVALLQAAGSRVKVWDLISQSAVFEWEVTNDGQSVEAVEMVSPNLVLTTWHCHTRWALWRIEFGSPARPSSARETCSIRWDASLSGQDVVGSLVGRIACVPPRAGDTHSLICFTPAGGMSDSPGRIFVVGIDLQTGSIEMINEAPAVAEYDSGTAGHACGLVAARSGDAPVGPGLPGGVDLFMVTDEAVSAHPLTFSATFSNSNVLVPVGDAASVRRSSQTHPQHSQDPAEEFTPGISHAAIAAASGAFSPEQFSESDSESESESESNSESNSDSDCEASEPVEAPSEPIVAAKELVRSEEAETPVNDDADDQGDAGAVDLDVSSDDATTDEDLALTASNAVPISGSDSLGTSSEEDEGRVAPVGSGLDEAQVAAIVREVLDQRNKQVEEERQALLATVAQTLNATVAFHVEKQVQAQVSSMSDKIVSRVSEAVLPPLQAQLAALSQQRGGQVDPSSLEGPLIQSFASAFESVLVPSFERASADMLRQLGSVLEHGMAVHADSQPEADPVDTGPTFEDLWDQLMSGDAVGAFKGALNASNPSLVVQLCAACDASTDSPTAADVIGDLGREPPTLLSFVGQVGLAEDFVGDSALPLLACRLNWLREAVMGLQPEDDAINVIAPAILSRLSEALSAAKESSMLPSEHVRDVKMLTMLVKALV